MIMQETELSLCKRRLWSGTLDADPDVSVRILAPGNKYDLRYQLILSERDKDEPACSHIRLQKSYNPGNKRAKLAILNYVLSCGEQTLLDLAGATASRTEAGMLGTLAGKLHDETVTDVRRIKKHAAC